MKNTRLLAATSLEKLFKEKRSLSDLFEELPQSLDHSERSLIKALCFGVCRWYFRLDDIAKRFQTKPFKQKDLVLQMFLLIGIYQLLYMRIPAHAVIHETVNAVKASKKSWASSIINAVLRETERQKEVLINLAYSDPVISYVHPAWLIDAIKEAWPNDWNFILDANNQHPPLILRVNTSKISRENYLKQIKEKNVEASILAQVPAAIKVSPNVSITELPGYETGLFSVQDMSAQLSALLIAAKPGERILDACAAPGGKTTHLLELYPNIDLIAIDNHAKRLMKLKENLQRLKQTATVICADAAIPKDWWDGNLFDRILLDAPCSSTGVIRRHPDIKLLREFEDIAKLHQQQLRLLKALWLLLKPNGFLLYVTCSVLPYENQDVIAEFLEQQSDAQLIPLNIPWAKSLNIGYQCLPGHHNADGFYYVALEKRSIQ